MNLTERKEYKMSFVERVISFKGFDFFYYTSNGESIKSKGISIFLHGLGDSHKSFEDLILHLDNLGYFVIFYDLPGSGKNKKVNIDFNDCIDLMHQIFSIFHNKNKVFFGHSLGGLIILTTLVKYPNLYYSNIITIEPSITKPDFEAFKHFRMPQKGVGYEGLIKELRESNPSGYMETYLKNLNNMNKSMYYNYVDAVSGMFNTLVEAIFSSNLKFSYFYGENSIGIDDRKKMSEYKNINVFSFKGAGHWVHQDANEAVLKKVLEILEK